jgi:hypothetical protein
MKGPSLDFEQLNDMEQTQYHSRNGKTQEWGKDETEKWKSKPPKEGFTKLNPQP